MTLNYRAIIRILGFVFLLLGLSMLPSALISFIYGEGDIGIDFIKIILPTVTIGILISAKSKERVSKLKMRESFLVVASSWVLASLIGCLPYLVTGTINGFTNAFFESVSGFTTTGATIIDQLESLPKGILFWRSFSQWMGGMGILVFAISILPMLGISGHHIAKAETPGINLNKIAPKMSDSAKILYMIYAFFTLMAIVLFRLAGLNLFDSFVASTACAASGGLSNYSSGLSHFNSIYIEFIAGFFTVLTCINYNLYYRSIRGKWINFLSNSELKVFLLILLLSGMSISLNLQLTGSCEKVSQSLRHGFFQTSAFLTTTGHYSADFDMWPTFSKMVLLLLMIIGASSSSTGGGIKIIRLIILFKLVARELFIRLHPRAVVPVKVQGKTLSGEVISGVVAFLSLYTIFFIISLLILSLEGFDFLTTVSTVASMINNVGTGMGDVGPGGSFAIYSTFSKVYLCFLMLLGRLELFTLLLIFTPSFWNPDR